MKGLSEMNPRRMDDEDTNTSMKNVIIILQEMNNNLEKGLCSDELLLTLFERLGAEETCVALIEALANIMNLQAGMIEIELNEYIRLLTLSSISLNWKGTKS
jgi:hypothetical protein